MSKAKCPTADIDESDFNDSTPLQENNEQNEANSNISIDSVFAAPSDTASFLNMTDVMAENVKRFCSSEITSDLVEPQTVEERNSGDSDDDIKIFNKKKVNQLDDVYDQELSDEDVAENNSGYDDLLEKKEINNISSDIKSNSDLSKRSTETKRFHKKKEEELLKIYGESQRMVRESSVSLPYHTTPKVTLQHFLDRKKYRISDENTINLSRNMLDRSDDASYTPSIPSNRPGCGAHTINAITDSSCTMDKQQNVKDPPVLLNSSIEIDVYHSLSKENVSETSEKSMMEVENNTLHKDALVVTDCKPFNELCDVDNVNSGIISAEKYPYISENMYKGDKEDSFKICNILTQNKLQENCTLLELQESHSNISKREPNRLSDEKTLQSTNQQTKESCTENLGTLINTTKVFGIGNDYVNKKTVHGTNTDTHESNKQNSPLSFLKTKILKKAPSFKPLLGGKENGIIDLNEDASKSAEKIGIEQFMERFVQHNIPSKCSFKPEVQLRIAVKKPQACGNIEIENSFVTFKLSSKEEQNPSLTAPGAKLASIKEQLWSKIKVKRKETMQERKNACQIDNEDIFENEEKEEEETDESEEEATDENEEEGGLNELDTDSEEEAEVLGIEYKNKKNDFLDDEADDEDSEHNFTDDEFYSIKATERTKCVRADVEYGSHFCKDDINNLLERETSSGFEIQASLDSDNVGNIEKKCKNNGPHNDGVKAEKKAHFELEMELHLDSDSEGENLPKCPASATIDTALTKDSSFEQIESTVPAYQPLKVLQDDKQYLSLESSHSNKDSSVNTNTTLVTTCGESSQCLWPSPNLSLSPLIRSQEWRNGVPSESEHAEHEHSSGIKPHVENSENEMFSEVLELCSGKFKFSCDYSGQTKEFLTNFQSSQENMKELLDLCSGQFLDNVSVVNEESSKDHLAVEHKKPHPKKLIASDAEDIVSAQGQSGNEDNFINDCEEKESHAAISKKEGVTFTSDEESSKDSLDVIQKKPHPKKLIVSDDEDNVSAQTQSGSEDIFINDCDEKESRVAISREENHMLKDFLDEEAELSGSDVGSDEDLDISDEDGQLEDEGPLLEDLPSEEELRNQIGKVHLKTLLDDDKQELRLFKEMYLEDGELYSEHGRERKFRWKNIGQEAENGSCSESDNDMELEEDEKWRIERYEREKWLQEQATKGIHVLQSPIKDSLKKSSVHLEIIQSASASSGDPHTSSSFLINPQDYLQKCPGSFITRGKDYLSCLAQKMKKTDDGTAGSRTTKHFVFRAVSPQNCEVKAAKNPTNCTLLPPLKRRKLKQVSETATRSVFDYLE